MGRKIIALTILLFLGGVFVVQAVEQNTHIMDYKTKENLSRNENINTGKKQDVQEADISSIGLSIGQKAPNIKAVALNGKSIDLSAFKGKKVILNFWAAWCPPCKEELPELVKFYNEHHSDVELIGINIESSKAQVMDFMKKYDITYPIIMDNKETISNQYEIQPIPTTYVIDEKGMIMNKQIGAVTYNHLKHILTK
ncbi:MULTISPECIES: TlpA family protein disulfide reductase [Heyndrickxia]|uniref:TlpA family protein disulfide reductase n=1 Tax=Heyndrickxia TaxID=2837504 RepID=UPI0006EC002A|nr:TlpA disulfide reductase family protein [Heyndrickxia shackletonii]NEY97723.1 TlpA family protein disulfide reductase [Heyndrickxia shackletonii]